MKMDIVAGSKSVFSDSLMEEFRALPSVKPKRIFEKLICEQSSDVSKPYYSIQYKENGKEYIGCSSYNLDVISNFLKKEFGMNIKIPKQGQWLKYDFVPSKNWICSECGGLATMGYESFAGYYNYCPNCGAKMEVKE